MEFSITQSPTLEGYTNENGRKGYFPVYNITIGGAYIASEYRQYNLTPEDVSDIISEAEHEIDAAICKAIAAHVRPYVVSVNKVKVEASVDLEVWIRDYANYVKTDTFDCELALDEFDLSELPPDGDFSEGACNFGDNVYFEAVRLGLTDDWDGPFTFHIDDWRAYDRYIAARVKNEYGYELRED